MREIPKVNDAGDGGPEVAIQCFRPGLNTLTQLPLPAIAPHQAAPFDGAGQSISLGVTVVHYLSLDPLESILSGGSGWSAPGIVVDYYVLAVAFFENSLSDGYGWSGNGVIVTY